MGRQSEGFCHWKSLHRIFGYAWVDWMEYSTAPFRTRRRIAGAKWTGLLIHPPPPSNPRPPTPPQAQVLWSLRLLWRMTLVPAPIGRWELPPLTGLTCILQPYFFPPMALNTQKENSSTVCHPNCRERSQTPLSPPLPLIHSHVQTSHFSGFICAVSISLSPTWHQKQTTSNSQLTGERPQKHTGICFPIREAQATLLLLTCS